MLKYIFQRLLLIIPTLFGILLINFMIIQSAPGGPVEQVLSKLRGQNSDADSRIGGGNADFSQISSATGGAESSYRGAQGIDPAFIKELEKQFGFDKPAHVRFFIMLKSYLRFDLGKSYFRDRQVIDILKEKLPVSISLGLWTILLVYLISIPLGIRKAVKDGTSFDMWTSALIIIGYAIPAFLFAILLIVFFAGGSYYDLFPLRGLVSANFDSLPWYQKVTDYLWHITLPVLATVVGGFAALTMLTKNSFLDEVRKQYVVTARAKGVSEKNILWKHVFRNAMLLVIAGFPATFISMFFTGSLLIEVMFSLNGLGLLGYESTVSRDYPVMFGTLYIFTLIGLLLNILSDISYTLVDPRIDFEGR